jgi:hypothetical protein
MAQVLPMIDSRNLAAMVEPTNIDYDIHAQNPDQGELSAAAGNAAAPKQIGHPAYGDFGPYANHDARGPSYASHTAYSAQPAQVYDHDGGEGDDAEEEYQAAQGEDDEGDEFIDQQRRLDQPLKLFIGQVPKNVIEDDLAFIFEPYGRILDLAVIRDRRSGNHRGCAFVTYENSEDAMKVVNELHGRFKFEGAPWPAQVRPAAGEIDVGNKGIDVEGKNQVHNFLFPCYSDAWLTCVRHSSF